MTRTFGRYGFARGSVSPLFFLILALLSLLSEGNGGAQEPAYLDSLLARSEQLRLHDDPYWWILLHYKQSLFGVRSLVDDPDFYLAQDGKHNPRGELEATLRGFFQPDREEAGKCVCRFIARFTWLQEQLGFDMSKVLVSECPAFNEIIEKINPASATLIFPTSYVNSPASMFGHTLISIETSTKSKLMSHAINYSATGVDRNGFLFAFKGIFGFYEGYFSILPYYQKVAEYSDINNRDMWEYPLHLTEEEVLRMLRHLWELQEIYSRYYFFDENCSYTLLFLLDAARPSLHLTDGFRPWVMPVDTIRAQQKKGVIDQAFYRPSKATRMEHIISLLDTDCQRLALAVIRGELEPADLLEKGLDLETEVRILDLVMEYAQVQYTKEELTKEEYVERFLEASKARSSLGRPEGYGYDIPAPSRPEQGHKPNRLSIGVGYRAWDDLDEGSLYQEIRFRPTYHDLLDSDKGYSRGAQIEFLSGVLRYYNSTDRVELERLDLVNIVSLAPRNRFFKPISWKVNTGLTQADLPGGDRTLVYSLNIGGGLCYDNRILGLCYGMFETEIDLGGGLSNAHSIGFGGTLGILRKITEAWKFHLLFRPFYFVLGEQYESLEWAFLQQYTIFTNMALSLELTGKEAQGLYQTEAGALVHLYF